MSEESKPAVLAAMGANFAIAGGKLVAGLLTGSAAMLAEAGHSIADTVNQVFLLVGINLSDTDADLRRAPTPPQPLPRSSRRAPRQDRCPTR